MTFTGKASLGLAMMVALPLLMAGSWATATLAARLSHADAMAACRAKYGKKVINAIVNKNGTFTCQWQVARPMTHAEVYEACKKKFHSITVFVFKKKDGWYCRYRG
jgi:hypothetical protein